MLPFEFTIEGPPLSHQTGNRRRRTEWQQAVLAAALVVWPPGDRPIDEPVQITIVYYHEGDTTRMDYDNLVKPIQDALNGRIYVDDRLITDARVRKTSINGSYRVRGMRQVVANAFVKGLPF